MKNILLVGGILVVVGLVGWYFWSGGVEVTNLNTPQNNTVENQDSKMTTRDSVMEMKTGTYVANTDESQIAWEAGKPAIAGYVHKGAFYLDSGSINLTNSEITGEFVVDIDSLKVTSLGGGKVGQESALESHLKGERFFDTEQYPTATFVITDVSPKVLPGPNAQSYTATGKLTMKGQTNDVTFPMKVTVASENEVWVEGDIELDRTKWGISFGSASIAEEITNNIIGDTVNINLSVKLTK